MTQQPEWKLIAQFGDAHPIDHGGYFIYTDTTGVYEAEGEMLIPLNDHDCDEGVERWTVYRFRLERCTYINGILSDNKFHPEHAAWFAKPESERANRPQDTTYLSNIASYVGPPMEELIAAFTSDDPRARAFAYQAVGDYHGYDNLDSYPLYLTREEVEKRYPRETWWVKEEV